MYYNCGSKLRDLPEKFSNVEIRDHSCFETTEKLYYLANYEPICVYCGTEQPFTVANTYLLQMPELMTLYAQHAEGFVKYIRFSSDG